LNIITVDLETYWSQTHSLSVMNPIVYCLHPDTEIQSAAIKFNDGPTEVFFGERNVRWALEALPVDTSIVVGHNMSGFDSMLLAWRLGVAPKLWGCTLAMARQAGLAKTAGGSLKALAEHFSLGSKLDLEATNTKGKRLADFTESEREAMTAYNQRDTDICFALFKKLLPLVDPRSLRLIHATVQMLVRPAFEVDVDLLRNTADALAAAQRKVLLEIGTDIYPFAEQDDEAAIEQARKMLASSANFSNLLKMKGVEVPMKPSPANPEKMIPALSKTDEGMQSLVEHENPDVAALAAARLGVKSTMLGTRIQNFLEVAAATGGTMPIALNYYGADNTGRWSGAMGLNQQNLARVDPSRPKLSDALRRCLRAPTGSKVVVADLSGIELRMSHYLWKVKASMALYDEDPGEADLYRDFAAKLFKKTPGDITSKERQLGKVAQLGLQFGAGHVTFRNIARIMGGVELSETESKDTVTVWRARYASIVRGWSRAGECLKLIAQGKGGVKLDPWGLCVTAKGGIKTPQGFIHYPDLRTEPDEIRGGKRWVYGTGSKKTFISGPKVVENCVQHLAREVMADMILTVQKRYAVVHTVHDEIVLVEPEEHAQEALDYMLDVMRAGVSWFPELITWGKGDIADTYGDAK
jgi:DNA polymerase